MTASPATARNWLTDLASVVDGDRPAPPWVIAELDQHAAAVRDILTLGVPGPAAPDGRPGVVLLAGYAQGLLAAQEPGAAPAPLAGAGAWVLLRLRAVCRLAALATPRPSTPV